MSEKKKFLPIGQHPATPQVSSPGPSAKRRLPLLPHVEVARDGDEDRPPWHWSAIGAVAIFVVWLPLAFLVNGWFLQGLLQENSDPAAAPLRLRFTMVGLNAVAFAVACFAGGFLVGRFSGSAGRKEATVSGFSAGAIAWALSAMQGARSGLLVWAFLLFMMIGIGAFVSRTGGRLGLRKRGSR